MRFVNVHHVLLIHVFVRVIILHVVLPCTALFMLNFIRPLVEIIGFVSLNDDCFHNFCMNNIPVAQLQIASLVDELLSEREGFVTFDCGNFFSKSDIVLLNADCIE